MIQSSKPVGLLEHLTGHLRSKLVMLLLAGLCWFFVRTDRQMEVDFVFPLRVDLDALPGLVLLEKPPVEVHVRLRGRGRSLLAFALFGEGDYVLRPEAEGSETHGVSTKNLRLTRSKELSVQSIFPAVIHFRLDFLGTRQLPVDFTGVLEPAEGYLLTGGPELLPAEVVVSGAQSVLDTLESVPTEPLDLRESKRDLDEEVELVLPWPTLLLARSTVRLSAQLERIGERRFTGIPLEVHNLSDTLLVTPDSFGLTVLGGERQLEALRPGDIRARLDLTRFPPGVPKLPCQVMIPPGFDWRDPEPALFDIRPARLLLDSLVADSLLVDSLSVDSLRFEDLRGDRPWLRFP